MAETMVMPAAMPAAGYTAGSASSFRASLNAASAGNSAASSFSNALRSAQHDQTPRSGHGKDDDRATAYAGASAAAATQAPAQPQSRAAHATDQDNDAPEASADSDGSQGKASALAALQGRVLTLLAGQTGAAQPPAANDPPPNAGVAAAPLATPPSTGGTNPAVDAQEPPAGDAPNADTALSGAATLLSQALHGVQVQLAVNSVEPSAQNDVPHDKKDKEGTTAAFAGMPATRAAHPQPQGAWAPSHRPDGVTATVASATAHAATATAAAATSAASGQPRLDRPSPRPAAQAATAAWASAGTQQADGLGATTPLKAIDQVADGLVMTVRQGKSEATISLQPASLGAVKVQLSSGQDGLIIRMSAEHDATGDLLRAHMGELREVLAGQQIAVSELHVLHNPPAPPAAGGQNAPQDGFAWQERPKPNQENANQGNSGSSGQADQDTNDDDHE